MKFIIDYLYKGQTESFDLEAKDWEEAEAKLSGWVVGELVFRTETKDD